MPSSTLGRILSQAELAALLGIQPRTVRTWERRGCPVVERGKRGRPSKYNSADVIRWREEQAVLAVTGDVSGIDIDEARRRKTVAEAALAEMELATRRSDLVEIEQVGAAVEAEYAIVRANFTSLPGEIALDLENLPAVEIQERLSAKVSEILTELTADEAYSAGLEPDEA